MDSKHQQTKPKQRVSAWLRHPDQIVHSPGGRWDFHTHKPMSKVGVKIERLEAAGAAAAYGKCLADH